VVDARKGSVYLATRDTGDRMYFVGTIAGIMRLLNRIRPDSEMLFPPS
jgi:hypothetical protein